MLHTGFIFDQIWCISTKLRICIRDVRILDRIQKRIFGDSGYFRPEDIYGTHTWQNPNIVCILLQYIVFMMYIGLIFDQILCISTKLSICIRNVRILDRIKNQIFGILALFAQYAMLFCWILLSCLVSVWCRKKQYSKEVSASRKCLQAKNTWHPPSLLVEKCTNQSIEKLCGNIRHLVAEQEEKVVQGTAAKER